jgi:tripartite motif-containing protein 71
MQRLMVSVLVLSIGSVLGGCGGSNASPAPHSVATTAALASSPAPTTAIVAPSLTASPTATATPVPADPASSPNGDGPAVFVWRTAGLDGHPYPIVRPDAIATDQQGNVYVVDGSYDQVVKFDQNGKELLAWGSNGEGHGDFLFKLGENPDHTGGIAIDAHGTIYVVDGSGRMQMFDTQGKFLGRWPGGGTGSGPGEFNTPTSVAIAPNGSFYVADKGNSRIQKFTAAGQFVTAWGSSGSGPGQFNGARAVAVDAAGLVYVADGRNQRVQVFDAKGTFLRTWGSEGAGAGQFGIAGGIAIDGQGNVYVGDNSGNCVEKFDTNGKFLGQWGSSGAGDGQLDRIFQLTVDQEGNIYEWRSKQLMAQQ